MDLLLYSFLVLNKRQQSREIKWNNMDMKPLVSHFLKFHDENLSPEGASVSP